MQIDIFPQENYQLAVCNGLLDDDVKAAFDQQIHPLIEQGGQRILFDLAGVPRANSNGIGQLVMLVARANSQGNRMVFARATPFLRAIARATRLDSFLAFVDTVEEGSRHLRD